MFYSCLFYLNLFIIVFFIDNKEFGELTSNRTKCRRQRRNIAVVVLQAVAMVLRTEEKRIVSENNIIVDASNNEKWALVGFEFHSDVIDSKKQPYDIAWNIIDRIINKCAFSPGKVLYFRYLEKVKHNLECGIIRGTLDFIDECLK